jgi:phosphoglycerate dehydrogenase-like enzyme
MRKKVLAPGLVPVVDQWSEQPAPSFLIAMQHEISAVAELDARRPRDASEWAPALIGVHVLAGAGNIDAEFLKLAADVEMVQTFGIGYDNIEVPTATRHGVIVCNVPEIYSEPVAQHAWALILDLSKQVSRADRSMRAGTWETGDWMGTQLWGRTLGVIGLGGNGSRIALKGQHAFNMTVLAYDPFITPARAQRYGATLVSLERVLKESDVVTVNVPLTSDTRHLIGEQELGMMKASAILVNTARGAVIDEKALIQCLREERLKGVGLDVYEEEPLDPHSPLLQLENIVLTPHIASSTRVAVEMTYRAAVSNVIRFVQGQRPNWIVNPVPDTR